MTEKEKQMCRNIAAIMRVKRLGVSWIAPQVRLSSGALQAIIAGKRKVSGEEATLLAKAMDVPYEAIYAETVEAAIENQFTPRNRRRQVRPLTKSTLVTGTNKDRKKGW